MLRRVACEKIFVNIYLVYRILGFTPRRSSYSASFGFVDINGDCSCCLLAAQFTPSTSCTSRRHRDTQCARNTQLGSANARRRSDPPNNMHMHGRLSHESSRRRKDERAHTQLRKTTCTCTRTRMYGRSQHDSSGMYTFGCSFLFSVSEKYLVFLWFVF